MCSGVRKQRRAARVTQASVGSRFPPAVCEICGGKQPRGTAGRLASVAADAPAEELVHPGCPLGVLNGQADDVAVPELRAVTGRSVLVRSVRQSTPSTGAYSWTPPESVSRRRGAGGPVASPPGPPASARDAFHASTAAMTGATFMKLGGAPQTSRMWTLSSLTGARPPQRRAAGTWPRAAGGSTIARS